MTGWMGYVVVGAGGFIGANVRYVVARWAVQAWGSAFPFGTLLINASGSFVLGLFATLALHFAWDDRWRLLIAVGFLGAFTTFSTFEYETLDLAMEGAWMRAVANVAGSILCGTVAVYAGVICGRLLIRLHA